MPISDMTPDASPTMTDEIYAAKLQILLKRSIQTTRQIIQRASTFIAQAPGGKAGINTALASTQVEASAILDELVALVNNHKATGSSDVTNPLL